MSVCLETSGILTSSVSTVSTPTRSTESTSPSSNDIISGQSVSLPKGVAKIVVANQTVPSVPAPVLQKVANSQVITVLNTAGPITVVKSLSSCSYANSASHFTLVNSAPLTVTSATGKTPTITLVNAPPITVVRPVTQQAAEGTSKAAECLSSAVVDVSTNNGCLLSVADKVPVHNVFVKNNNTSLVPVGGEAPQGQKFLTANSFSQNNIIQAVSSTCATQSKSSNAQRPVTNGKVKILSNMVMPGAVSGSGSPGVVLNKANMQRYYTQQKVISNGATKYVSKMQNNVKGNTHGPDVVNKRLIYSTQVKTLPSTGNYSSKSGGIKTLSPQAKSGIPVHVQRTCSGLRTIPPQRTCSRPNYIGKHAVQAQRVRASHGIGKVKTSKIPSACLNRPPQSSQVTFNQALTAQILETLGQDNNGSCNSVKTFEVSPRYDSHYSCPEASEIQRPAVEHKSHTNLDYLSLICQAVLLDHNYNATLPTEPPSRSLPPATVSNQHNGLANSNLYSPVSGGRSSLGSTNTLSTVSSVSTNSLIPSNSTTSLHRDEDAASDISCGSEHKPETEGEETDTAPEAEAVNYDDQFDHYGDYVTRCICGFLHDDGYMIECDKCKVWQHVRCVVKTKKVPDDYLCEMCDPSKPTDAQKARFLQQQWMREGQEQLRKEAKLRDMKLKEALTDTDSSDADRACNNNNNNNNSLTKNRTALSVRRKSELVHRQNNRQRRDSNSRRPVKRKERKPVKRKTKSQVRAHSDDDNQDGWSQSSATQLQQWIENYEEAVTNHYSPELRARVSSIRINGVHSELSAHADTSVHKCRVYSQPLTGIKSLLSTSLLEPNSPVIELRGKYMLSMQHRNVSHCGTLTTRQHSQRPGPFLFFYRLQKDNTEVCVDTRTYGNDARFIRRSCRPNSELRHCIEKGVLHLYIITTASVEKNVELTIRHESHDLAAIGSTSIACACGSPEECNVNKVVSKKNGENSDTVKLKKRRCRRAASVSAEVDVAPQILDVADSLPEEAIIKQEVEIKKEIDEIVADVKSEDDVKVKCEPDGVEQKVFPDSVVKKEEDEEDEEENQSPPAVTGRRSSTHKQEDEKKDTAYRDDKNKKLSREERKIEAYMKAFERMERQQQRKQEHQAKQANRRESEPGPGREDEKMDHKVKRRRRKGRARTVSTNSQASRCNRLNSADSSYATSGDESLLSPNDKTVQNQMPILNIEGDPSKKAAGMLLTLANGESKLEPKSPPRDVDSNSNSAQSSPETPLSSACLLVAAAVGPLEPGFKFPKTKKGLMNEWLNKSPDLIRPASALSPSSLTSHIVPALDGGFYESSASYMPPKNLVALAQAATYCDLSLQPRGSAKKRWLRQAISEDQCESPRPESPPVSELVAPPKKRRLPRESLSTDVTPPSTPNSNSCTGNDDTKQTSDQESRVEIVYSGTDGDSPTQVLESDAVLKERAAEMQQEFGGACLRFPPSPCKEMMAAGGGCLLDPRLVRDRPLFSNSDHLVGTVEKTLSFLGFEDQKMEVVTPTKRKLSITEYRQRKKLSTNEKTIEEPTAEESNSCQSPRPRSNSASSEASLLSSDEEVPPVAADLVGKVVAGLSAFNSEPTELERQRESVSLRLKKAFGLSVEEDPHRAALDVETLLNCELPPVIKSTVPLPSPTFPIPGSSEAPISSPQLRPPVEVDLQEVEEKPVLFYTPDDEEDTNRPEESQEVVKYGDVKSTSYVPPFNNPLYPNSSFSTYGSVIDDDAPYEGRNPSPPPDLNGVTPGSYIP